MHLVREPLCARAVTGATFEGVWSIGVMDYNGVDGATAAVRKVNGDRTWVFIWTVIEYYAVVIVGKEQDSYNDRADKDDKVLKTYRYI